MNALAQAVDTALIAERNLANRFLAQTDYVSLLNGHVEYDKMYVKSENSLNWITVMLKRKEEKSTFLGRSVTTPTMIS